MASRETSRVANDMVIANVEMPLIQDILERVEGNQTQAAELLGMNRNTLRKKMKLYGLL